MDGVETRIFNGSHLTVHDTILPGLVSDTLYWRLSAIVLAVDLVAASVATTANIITILVYRRLGFTDPTTISLTALAVSDLGVAVTTFNCVLSVLLPTIPGAPFTMDIFMIFAATPHVLFTRSSALITTYLSVERFLCVYVPLKVKRIITRKRTLVAMVIIFVAAFFLMPIIYFRYPIGWEFNPETNQTVLGALYVSDRIIHISFSVYQVYVSLCLPIFTFFTVLINTTLLAISLQKSKAWRDANKSQSTIQNTVEKGGNSVSTSSTPSSTSKETRAVQMVIGITTVFIISSIPSSIHMIFVLAVPGFDLNGRYAKLFALTGMMFLFVDCINCSANVCIYYIMSSKFRYAMLALFKKRNT